MSQFRDTMQSIGRQLGAQMTAVFGDTLDSYYFTKTDATLEDVPCNPSGRNEHVRLPGASVQDILVQFVIPITDTFPGANIPSNYDVVTYQGVSYWVKACNTDNLQTRWYLQCTKRENIG